MNTKLKKFLSTVLVSTSIVVPNVVNAEVNQKYTTGSATYSLDKTDTSSKEIKVYLNGEQLEFDVPPVEINGRTKVPFRKIFESMGTVVWFNEVDNSIFGTTIDGDEIRHTIGTNKATINGVEKTYDSISEVINDRTLIPVRMVADLLGADVSWIEQNNEVQIKKEKTLSENSEIISKVLEHALDNNFNPKDYRRYISYLEKHPEKSVEEVILDVNMDLDREMIEVDGIKNIPGTHLEAKEEDISIIEDTNNVAMLINKFNRLPDNYQPSNITEVYYEYKTSMGTERLNSEAYNAFIEMYNYAKDNGIDLKIIRSITEVNPEKTSTYYYIGNAYHLQQENYMYNLYPLYNFNELQTGLAINVVETSDSYWYYQQYSKDHGILGVDGNGEPRTQGSADFDYMEAAPIIEKNNIIYNWIEQNSYKYGYVVRYPKDKENITGYYYMPWHLRYVGKDIAKIMHDENLCLEEYYARYVNPSNYTTTEDSVNTVKKLLLK